MYPPAPLVPDRRFAGQVAELCTMRVAIITGLGCATLRRAFLAAGCAAAMIGTAHAQGRSPEELPPRYMFGMSTIGQSWGEMLKGYGIYLNGGAYQNFYHYFQGRKTGSEGQGEDTFGADLDMGRIAGIAGAAIHISTDLRWGANPSDFTGAGIMNTANYGPNDSYRLAELSWGQSLLNDHVRVLVGRMPDNIDFAVSDIYCQFLFSTCGQVNSWYFDNSNPSYPVSNWGARVTLKPTLSSYFRSGIYRESTIQSAPNHFGWPGTSWGFGHTAGMFVPVEIGYNTNVDQDPLPRGFDIGGYYDSSRAIDPIGRIRQGRSALYLQAQQMVVRPDPSSRRGITVFAEAFFDTGGAGPIARQFVGGFSWTGPLRERPAEALNVSVNYWQWNRTWIQAFEAATGAPPSRSQWLLELNYGYQLAPGVELKPVVGYVINPDLEFGLATPTRKRVSSSWIVGAQLAVGFTGACGLPAFIRTN